MTHGAAWSRRPRAGFEDKADTAPAERLSPPRAAADRRAGASAGPIQDGPGSRFPEADAGFAG